MFQGIVSMLVRFWFTAQMAVHGIAANPMRSGLTLLGVAIGVTSVITLMGIGEGARQAVIEQFESLGSNVIVIKAETAAYEFKPQQAEELLQRVPSLTHATPVIQDQLIMRWRRARGPVSVIGVNEQFLQVRDHQLLAGNFFNTLHIRNRASVAVLGYNVATGLLGGRSPVGYTMMLEGRTYHILGVLAPKGAGKADQIDDKILIPYTSALMLFQKATVPEIWAKAGSEDEAALAVAHLGRIFKRSMGMDPGAPSQGMQDFPLGGPGVFPSPAIRGGFGRMAMPQSIKQSGEGGEPGESTGESGTSSQGESITITNLNQAVEEADQANRIMTLLLGGIAAVSLLVGGLGIMNIMLVSVSERTAEIGVRRAIGATRLDLLLQFILEAVYLSGLGAFAGVIAGMWASQLFADYGLQSAVSSQAIWTATMVALGSGVLFGVYPAVAASSMPPVEALRR